MSNPLDTSFTDGLKSDVEPSGYPKDWPEISAEFRKQRNYTCHDCGVCCEKFPGLTDAHHLNSDKSNCEHENLQCLCKYHHAKRHSHYPVKESDKQKLRRLWDEQEIAVNKRK